MNRRDVEQARAEEQRLGLFAGAVQDGEAGERRDTDQRLDGPEQIPEPRRQLVDLAEAERNFARPQDEDAARKTPREMADRIFAEILERDSLIFPVGVDARGGVLARIGWLGPDAADVLPLVDVLQHRRGG